MTDAPGPSTPHRPFKRKAGSFFNSTKRLRCGPNSYFVVGNPHDPLNLDSDISISAPFRDPSPPDLIDDSDPLNLDNKKNFRKKKKKQKHDKIVSEDNTLNPVFISQRRFSVVQQKMKQSYLQQHQAPSNANITAHTPAVRQPKTVINNYRYRFGNFNRYYGNQPQMAVIDSRLSILCKDMFTDKDVIDVGCNSGLLTISLAKEFLPKKIVGVDLDAHLIRAAEQNIRYFVDRDMKFMHRFPLSFPHCYGPITVPPIGESTEFPYNIKFITENYVLEKDSELDGVEAEYDVALMLATTKWIHLNFGDQGMKRAFKRIHKQLRPNGKFIVEILKFDTYRHDANTCPILKSNYEKIQFKPEAFKDYLLSEEVGFRHFEDIGVAFSLFKGPVYIFFKEDIVFHYPPAREYPETLVNES